MVTFVAGHVVGGDDAVSGCEPLHPGADVGDLAGDLVSEHQRRLLPPVPFHDVGAADAAGLDPEQQLARTRLGHRQLLQPNVIVAVIHGDAHGLFLKAGVLHRTSGQRDGQDLLARCEEEM